MTTPGFTVDHQGKGIHGTAKAGYGNTNAQLTELVAKSPGKLAIAMEIYFTELKNQLPGTGLGGAVADLLNQVSMLLLTRVLPLTGINKSLLLVFLEIMLLDQ